jgi:putative FmdB family regulatory protein
MPTYDLMCLTCGHEEEFYSSKMVFDTGQKCPKCEIALTKKIGVISSIFKGPGFYATEHGKSQYNYKNDKKNIEERDSFIAEAKKDMEAGNVKKA